jgi:hypothetical protein
VPEATEAQEAQETAASDASVPGPDVSEAPAPKMESATLPRAAQVDPSRTIPAHALVVAPTKYGKDIVEIQGLTTDTSYVNLDELVLIERPAGAPDSNRSSFNNR